MTRIAQIVSAALAAAVLAAPAPASDASAGGTAAGNAVTRWVEHSLDAVRSQNVATPDAGRLYAMVTVAMYDAVNGIDGARRHGRTHALVPPSGAPVNGQRDVAVAAAAHAVLTALLRADRPPVSVGALDAALTAELDAAGGEGARSVGTAQRPQATQTGLCDSHHEKREPGLRRIQPGSVAWQSALGVVGVAPSVARNPNSVFVAIRKRRAGAGRREPTRRTPRVSPYVACCA